LLVNYNFVRLLTKRVLDTPLKGRRTENLKGGGSARKRQANPVFFDTLQSKSGDHRAGWITGIDQRSNQEPLTTRGSASCTQRRASNVKSTRGEPLTKAHERRQSTDRGESSRLQCIMPRPLGRNPRRGRNSQERIERRQLNNMRPVLRILRMPRVQKRQRDQTESARIGFAEESAPV